MSRLSKEGTTTYVRSRSRWFVPLLLSFFICIGRGNLSDAFVQTTVGTGSKQAEFNFGKSHEVKTWTGTFSHHDGSCKTGIRKQSTQLYSFMGSDGGLLGIGTPELFTIILIGYFVLGPSDLYKLVKEIGKFIQNFQTFASEATSTLENNMESQLQLEEIRKAQRELNDAFSFRRSINVEADSDPFEVNVQSPRGQDDVAASEMEYDLSTTASAGAAVAPKKKKMRRVKRKKKAEETQVQGDTPIASQVESVANQPLANDVPSELSIDDELLMAENKAMEAILNGSKDLDEKETDSSQLAAQIREERMERLERGQSQQSADSNEAASSVEQSRFQQQLSGDWNSQILANNDKLEPLAEVMNLLAVLEEEKIASDQRLKEEFKAREANEEKFYLEKRKVLEEAAASIQASAYAGNMQGSQPIATDGVNNQ